MEELYFLISGAHKSIPIEEVQALHEAEGCPFSLLSVHEGLVLGKGDPDCSSKITYRSAYVKEVGEVLAIGDEIGITIFKEFGCNKYIVKKIGGFKVPDFQRHLRGEGRCKVISTEGFFVISKPLSERKRGKTEKGPFFSPGSMDPILARAMINLSRLKPGDTFLDPFCGTAVFAVEASRVARRVYCSDLDPAMCYGGRINLMWAGALGDNILADSYTLPLRKNSVGSIATDPPYGRSVVSLAHEPEDLFAGFLEEASKVLRSGSWISFAMSSKINVEEIVSSSPFVLNACHVQRVHRSLARLICSAKLP